MINIIIMITKHYFAYEGIDTVAMGMVILQYIIIL